MIKKVSFCLIPLLIFSHFTAIAYDRDYDDDSRDYTCHERCSEKIQKLEEEIAVLKDRLRRQANCVPTTQTVPAAADTWICKYQGFANSLYSATGATKAVADQAASDKCKSQDKDNGFFCKFASCSQ